MTLKTHNGKIEGCLTTSNQSLTLADAACILFIRQQRETFAWLDEEQQTCGLFYSDFLFYNVEAEKCALGLSALWNQKTYIFYPGWLTYLTLNYLNKSPAVIESVSLPRMDAPLFRGIAKEHFHYHAEAILRGLLGLDRHILPSDQFSKAMNLPRKPSVNDAIKGFFWSYFSSQQKPALEAKYTNAYSGSYISWPKDVVFGTLFYQAAESYAMGDWLGGNGIVLAFHDYLKRGVDLNYAMGLLGEVNSYCDAGEYLMPLLIDTSEFDGLIFPVTHQAYFRVSDQGRTYLLVYKNAGCIFKDSADKNIYICNSQDHPYSSFTIHQAPESPARLATASAVISVCNSNEPCNPPDAAFLQKYSVKLESEFALDVPIEKLSDSNHIVKAFWKP